MNWDETANFESDPRFLTGPWEGFWTQDGRVGSMQLNLDFVEGRIKGEGNDRVGAFEITGRYWPSHGTIVLRKQYLDRHTVWYRGQPFCPYLKGDWRIASTPAGGRWRIWPVEDEFELTRLVIESADGPVVIHGEITDDDKETIT